jgi:hypothetical protein
MHYDMYALEHMSHLVTLRDSAQRCDTSTVHLQCLLDENKSLL